MPFHFRRRPPLPHSPRLHQSPFLFYHAQKEAQFRANEKIADDLAYFFSGDYLSANDLNTARTLAYLAQTMLQTLHLAQNEFITSCGEEDWRNTVVQSINANHDYRFPEPTVLAPPQAQTPALAPTPPQPQPPTPSPTPVPLSTPVQSAPLSPQSPAPATAGIRPAPAATPTPTPNATSPSVGAGLARPEPPTTRASSQSTAEPNHPSAPPASPNPRSLRRPLRPRVSPNRWRQTVLETYVAPRFSPVLPSRRKT